MSSHDEFSSDEEEEEASQVFLGYIDAPIDADEQPTIEDTFLGGEPAWLHPDVAPPAELLHCGHCTAPMALYLQACAPVDGTFYDRSLYVFGCKKGGCRRQKGAVRCLRGICKDSRKMKAMETETQEATRKLLDEKLKIEEKKKLAFEVTKDLFGKKEGDASNNVAAANPFGGNPFAQSNPFSQPEADTPFGTAATPFGTAVTPFGTSEATKPSFSEVATRAAPPKAKKIISPKVKLSSFPGSFVYVEAEKLTKVTEALPANVKIDSSALDTAFEAPAAVGGKNTITPEAQQIASMMEDKQFQHFTSVVQHNPQQVLRYDMGGKPLLYTSKDDVARVFVNENKEFRIPTPGFNPSSQRRFELQLMPKAIMDLDSATSDILADGMEWGTIICCTDVEDYIPEDRYTIIEADGEKIEVAYVEEWCGVQWE
ncbi:hypothetical protein BABINDRAFT_178157 [Babjeviella inositovora NRRL Y-12698]|uniref:Programmed cell death protein 2 C-terminal domain-containing protein n=1 Tax=Babjeviella inositovora NRRL Y-12698 TaxID=984486 RepID=A0A1E3QI50_9ASCO|nr:uncharacterized protein BABINDRAFT_178157 [Babjeviella inositovora NRRL Y-12698]ODQ77278.1 hypothetical protein BABINDRAFT_178157 [Babjeviella inositovora NRRL Y-12698]